MGSLTGIATPSQYNMPSLRDVTSHYSGMCNSQHLGMATLGTENIECAGLSQLRDQYIQDTNIIPFSTHFMVPITVADPEIFQGGAIHIVHAGE